MISFTHESAFAHASINWALPSVDPSLTKSNSHLDGRSASFSNRSRNNGKTFASFKKGMTMLSSGCFMALYCESSDQITFVRLQIVSFVEHRCKQSRILENSR